MAEHTQNVNLGKTVYKKSKNKKSATDKSKIPDSSHVITSKDFSMKTPENKEMDVGLTNIEQIRNKSLMEGKSTHATSVPTIQSISTKDKPLSETINIVINKEMESENKNLAPVSKFNELIPNLKNLPMKNVEKDCTELTSPKAELPELTHKNISSSVSKNSVVSSTPVSTSDVETDIIKKSSTKEMEKHTNNEIISLQEKRCDTNESKTLELSSDISDKLHSDNTNKLIFSENVASNVITESTSNKVNANHSFVVSLPNQITIKKMPAVSSNKVSVGTQAETESSQSTASSSKCLRHSATVIAEDNSSPMINGPPDLCLSCSKSMLSYIVLIQRFLDGLAQNISRQIDPLTQCFECVKENLNIPPTTHNICERHISEKIALHSDTRSSRKLRKTSTPSRTSNNRVSEISSASGDSVKQSGTSRTTSEEHLRYSESSKASYQQQTRITSTNRISNNENKDNLVQRQRTSDEIRTESYLRNSQQSYQTEVLSNNQSVQRQHQQVIENNQNVQRQHQQVYENNQNVQRQHQQVYEENRAQVDIKQQSSHSTYDRNESDFSQITKDNRMSSYLQENRRAYNVSNNNVISNIKNAQFHSATNRYENLLSKDNLTGHSSPEYLHAASVDGILSVIHDVQRGVRGISKDPTVWQQIVDGRVQPIEKVNNEAFVTIVRSNTEVLGSLVLAASLLLCGTNRNLCVIVSDSVNSDFMPPLSSMFHEVIHTRSFDSVGNTKLALLDQPELGISYPKLNVWRLKQFTKCIYLNPDTLVVQNCDELFCYDELSAVPDIGWPDCFNSGVFVFKPSDETFWDLLEYAETQGSYNGGEQGLLNGYFTNWSQDIHKKLSFIYNLMANVSYTYSPAFKQFGRNVKVVQFLGSLKPWHVKFVSNTGQIAQSSTVHPTYVQFVHVWLSIFRISILPLFSPEIQTFSLSQNIICANELLRFFPSPMESDVDFLLTPPSVRISPQQNILQMSSIAVDQLQLPNIQLPSPDDEALIDEQNILPEETKIIEETPELLTSEIEVSSNETAQISSKSKETLKPKNLIPGAEVGDFQGMSAWEQGRMDYEGSAKSDTILKRLSYLIKKSDRLV